MRLPGTTTYEEWDALRRERFTVMPNMGDVTVQHNRYETCLFFGPSGNSGIATWDTGTGSCYIKTRRQAIFSVLQGMRNYMMNALGTDTWVFEDVDTFPERKQNIDNGLPWGVLFADKGHDKG